MKNLTTLRLITTIAMSFLLSGVLLAQQEQQEQQDDSPSISEQELQGPSVDFQNRNNQLAPASMRQREFSLGRELARGVMENGNASGGGIQVRRVFNRESEGFGADILSIQENSNYGHINRINRILAGYLAESFQYELDQGQVVGRFILDYNGRNRGSADLLQNSYSPEVQNAVSAENLGIAISYREWPGNTGVIIPLTKNIVRPNGADVDRDEITEGTATSPEDQEEMEQIDQERTEEDTERLDEKEQELEQKQQELDEQEKQLEEQEKQIDEELEQQQEKLEEVKQDPESTPEDIEQQEQTVQEVEEEKEQNQQQQQQTEQQQQEVTEQQEEVQEQKQQMAEEARGNGGSDNADTTTETATGGPDEGANQAATTDQNAEELQQENQELREQIEQQEQKSKNVVNNKILVLRVIKYIKGGHYNNELWQIDPVNDDALSRGPFTNICGREFLPVEGAGVIVVGYETADHTDDEHRLILLDSDSLKFKKSTAQNVHWRTPLIFRDEMVYAIEIHEGQYYLSRFTKDLAMDARSAEPINPDSDITYYNEKIYVTGKGDNGGSTTIQVFNRNDLTHIKKINPGG